MIYENNTKKERLSRELFKNPGSEYRGTPFWAWNCKLEEEELHRQIDVFDEMGLGGFHMHVRTGLENEYLSDEYMCLSSSGISSESSTVANSFAAVPGRVTSRVRTPFANSNLLM